MARTALAPAPAPLPLDIGDFDRWRNARTQQAYTVVAYTSVKSLYDDYCAWAEADLGLDAIPTETNFAQVLRTSPKILIETLRVRAFGVAPAMGECANLTLLDPIRTRA